jgi:hypothetical protein
MLSDIRDEVALEHVFAQVIWFFSVHHLTITPFSCITAP